MKGLRTLSLLLVLYTVALVGGVKTAYACQNIPGQGQFQTCYFYGNCCDPFCFEDCIVVGCNAFICSGGGGQNEGQLCNFDGCYDGPYCTGPC